MNSKESGDDTVEVSLLDLELAALEDTAFGIHQLEKVKTPVETGQVDPRLIRHPTEFHHLLSEEIEYAELKGLLRVLPALEMDRLRSRIGVEPNHALWDFRYGTVLLISLTPSGKAQYETYGQAGEHPLHQRTKYRKIRDYLKSGGRTVIGETRSPATWVLGIPAGAQESFSRVALIASKSGRSPALSFTCA